MTLAEAEEMLRAAGFEPVRHKGWKYQGHIMVGLTGTRERLRRWWARVQVPFKSPLGFTTWNADGYMDTLAAFLAAVPHLGAGAQQQAAG